MTNNETPIVSKRIIWKKIIKHLAIIFILIIALVFIFLLWLRLYTNHGDAFSVPNFKGLNIQKAKATAKEKGLKLIVQDSVYSPNGQPGAVIDQNPPADFKVKKHRRIFVTINSIVPKMIKMPDFRDMTYVQAKADMESYGLKIGKITYKPSKFDNVVLEQEYQDDVIEPGTQIAQFSKINLILGKSEGMGNSYTPMLIGLTKSEAQTIINDNNLNLGTVLFDETVISEEDSAKATVRKQFPLPNVPLAPGDEVDLWISMLKDTVY